MDDQWKKALSCQRVMILDGLANPESVADCLFVDGIINDEMKAKIYAKETKKDKSREMLDTLYYRGRRSVLALYNAFKETSNENLADLLEIDVKRLTLTDNLTDPTKWPPSESDHNQMKMDRVSKILQTNSPFLHEYNKKDVYKMQNPVRGKVLIINNEFKGMINKRLGSEKDVEILTKIFQELHFDVESNNEDLTATGMYQFLEKKRKEVAWDQMECLILVLMSHGVGSRITGSDNKDVEINQLLDIFSSQNCRGLDNKPRLVFVQACRGPLPEGAKSAVKVKQSDQLDSEQANTANTPNTSPTEMKHPLADFLVAYATPEGTLSWRDVYTGSWFISAVAWTLKYHAHHEELQHLLIRVNRIVATGYASTPEGKPKFTVSEVKSNLRKKFYFFPGIYGEKPELIN